MQDQSYLFRKIFFLIIAVILNSGCVQRGIIPIYPSTPEALFSISNAISEDDTLRGSAQINVVTSQGYFPLRAAVIIKKPAYLRLELIPPMGPPDFFLAATPQEMKILLPEKGEVYQGEPNSLNMSRFLPWHFDLQDIVAVFTCTYPPLTGDVSYLRYPEENNLRIEMKVGSRIMQRVWIGSAGRLSKIERYDEMGKLLFNAEFANYTEGSPIAGKIYIVMADGITSITVKYTDLKIEKEKDLSIFDLPVPDGFKKIYLD